MDLKLVPVAIPENASVIIGQIHSIKTVGDLYEVMVTTVPIASGAPVSSARSDTGGRRTVYTY